MPKHIANGLIYMHGRTHRHGEEIELTEAEAEALGKKVVPMEVAAPEKALNQMTVKELKALAKTAGIENYSKLNQKQLIAVIEAVQPEVVVAEEKAAEPAVMNDADESNSG